MFDNIRSSINRNPLILGIDVDFLPHSSHSNTIERPGLARCHHLHGRIGLNGSTESSHDIVVTTGHKSDPNTFRKNAIPVDEWSPSFRAQRKAVDVTIEVL